MRSKSVWFAILLLSVLGLVARAEIIRDTSYSNGADTFVGNDSNKGPDNNYGGGASIDVRSTANTRAHIGYVRFDISEVTNMTGAQLQFDINSTNTTSTQTWNIWGLTDEADDNWDEMTITYNNSPWMLAATTGNYAINGTKLTLLGTLTFPGAVGLVTTTTADLNLDSFLAADTNGLVTFVFTDANGSGKQWYASCKELAATDPLRTAPTLIMPNGSLSGMNVIYPANGQEGVELNVTLQWEGTADPNDPNLLDPSIMKHYVYIDFDNTDTDPNLYYEGQVVVSDWSSVATSYGPLSLSLDQSVSWRIEEGLDNGLGGAYAMGDPNNILGPVWSFTALRSVPIVSQDQPVSVRVFPAESVVFTVDFSSISTPGVKWYKDDNATVTEVTTGINTTDNGGGSYTTTLDMGASVESSDEGQYYCAVTNNSGPTEYPSGVADLVVKRLLAQYDFAGTLDDSSANSAPSGTAMDSLGDPNTATHVAGTINYVDGADGIGSNALYLDPNEYVNFGVEGYPKASAATTNGFGGSLDEGTIVFWVKPNVDGQQTILANFNDGSTTAFLSLFQADQDLDLYIRGANGTTLANHVAARPDRPEYDLTDGNWHMMAACWNGNTSTLYVDGQWVINNTGGTPASYNAWQRGVLLGATRTSADRNLLSDMFAGGAIDNLRIYNYRLDAGNVEAFAQEYLDNTGIYPCTNMSFLSGMANTNFDNTGSSYCKVDLADFAVFAETWLVNGLY